MAPWRLLSASTSRAGTKTNSGAGSMNRVMSQGHAMRSTRARSRVIHFMMLLLSEREDDDAGGGAGGNEQGFGDLEAPGHAQGGGAEQERGGTDDGGTGQQEAGAGDRAGGRRRDTGDERLHLRVAADPIE